MENRLTSFVNLKKNAYHVASNRGFFNGDIRTYDISLNQTERYITENIIRQTWKYHECNNINITDGQETRLIMRNCIYAGMLAAKIPNEDADVLLELLSQPNITRIRDYVEGYFCFDDDDIIDTGEMADELVEKIYEENRGLYSYCSTPEKHWEYYKDFACVMFELGALYYENRLAGIEDDEGYFDFEEDEFSYSIEVAREIYRRFKTQEEANKQFYNQLNLFFQTKRKKFESFNGNGIVGFDEIVYQSVEQKISVSISNYKEASVSAIMLPIKDAYTRSLFEEGLSKKCLFGLPILRMQWWEEMDSAFVYFITRDAYLQFDTPSGRMEKDLFGF